STSTMPLSQAAPPAVSVQYATQPDTARGDDFTPTSRTLTFAPGQTQQVISVPVLSDGGQEPNERFGVFLSNATGASIWRSRGTATIPGDVGVGSSTRPDGEIKRAGAPYRGLRIFNLTGTRQTQRAAARPRHLRVF